MSGCASTSFLSAPSSVRPRAKSINVSVSPAPCVGAPETKMCLIVPSAKVNLYRYTFSPTRGAGVDVPGRGSRVLIVLGADALISTGVLSSPGVAMICLVGRCGVDINYGRVSYLLMYRPHPLEIHVLWEGGVSHNICHREVPCTRPKQC